MRDSQKNDKNKKGDEDMAIAEKNLKKLNVLRKSMKLKNKSIPVLKSGKKGAIELDPKKSSHRDWYEGR